MKLLVVGNGSLTVSSSGKLHTDDHVESAHRGRDGFLEIALGPHDAPPLLSFGYVGNVIGDNNVVCGVSLPKRAREPSAPLDVIPPAALDSISASGLVTVSVDSRVLSVHSIALSASGKSRVVIVHERESGPEPCPVMVAHVSGASSVCGGGLAVRDATLHASGSGTVRGFDVRGGCVL